MWVWVGVLFLCSLLVLFLTLALWSKSTVGLVREEEAVVILDVAEENIQQLWRDMRALRE